MSDINTSKKNKSEGINLFISYLLLIITTITTIILLGCQFGHNKKDEEYTFYSPQEVDDYLMSHKQIHLIAPNSFASNESDDFLDWIWDKNNYDIQNASNGFLSNVSQNWLPDYEMCSININNNSFVCRLTTTSDGSSLVESIKCEMKDSHWELTDTANDGEVNYFAMTRNDIVGAYNYSTYGIIYEWYVFPVHKFFLSIYDYPDLRESFESFIPSPPSILFNCEQ